MRSTAEKIIRQPRCEFLLFQIPIAWGGPSGNGHYSIDPQIKLISYIRSIMAYNCI